MKDQNLFKIIIILGLIVLLISINDLLYTSWKNNTGNEHVKIIQTTMTVPSKYRPGQDKIIRVKIEINDDVEKPNETISYAEFDQYSIPLSPDNPSKLRADIFFKKTPGKYVMTWTIQSKIESTQSTTYKKIIILNENDAWRNIAIDGRNFNES